MRYRTGKLAELGKRKLIVDTQDALAKFYGDDFYKKQVGASLASAMTYAALLAPLFRPASVVDLGCGRGTWLDLSPKFHPVASRIRSSFGPVGPGVATAWGAKPSGERSAPGCCGTEALRAA